MTDIMIDFPKFLMYGWLVVWSLVGSTLGFYTVRVKHTWSGRTKCLELLKSLAVGLFFAIPSFMYLREMRELSMGFAVAISGTVSFAITDLIINAWPRIMRGLTKLINHLIDKV